MGRNQEDLEIFRTSQEMRFDLVKLRYLAAGMLMVNAILELGGAIMATLAPPEQIPLESPEPIPETKAPELQYMIWGGSSMRIAAFSIPALGLLLRRIWGAVLGISFPVYFLGENLVHFLAGMIIVPPEFIWSWYLRNALLGIPAILILFSWIFGNWMGNLGNTRHGL